MTSRRRLYLFDDDVEVAIYTGWRSWLLGLSTETHPGEGELWIHVGPVALFVWWRRARKTARPS